MIEYKKYKDYISPLHDNVTVEVRNPWHEAAVGVELIHVQRGYNFRFDISRYPYFCGGVFLSNIRYYDTSKDEILEVLLNSFKYLSDTHHGIVGYISTTQQQGVNTVLKELGFLELHRFVNPNTDNKCIEWVLKLEK